MKRLDMNKNGPPEGADRCPRTNVVNPRQPSGAYIYYPLIVGLVKRGNILSFLFQIRKIDIFHVTGHNKYIVHIRRLALHATDESKRFLSNLGQGSQ